MRRLPSFLAALLLFAADASAMQQGDTPPKFPIPWANSAGSSYVRSIPTTSQIGVQNCAASLTDGFPPLTFVPASAGGCPPFGQDFNGILKQATQWSRWGQAGGPVFYDSAFAAAIGGYPKGATLSSAVVPGNAWLSTADDNATDPDAGGAGWVPSPGQVPSGTPVASLTTVIPASYVSSNGTTVGNASSGASGRASNDTRFLFAVLWSGCANCAVSPGGRGASAASDFAANKTITTPNLNGAALVGADSQNGSTTSNLAGVPVISGSAGAPTSLVGENLHALTAAENGTHAHADTLTDPGHVHGSSVTDPGHAHADTLTDPGHVHAVGVTDPGHTHGNIITQAQFPISSGGTGPFLFGASIGGGAGALISSALTGISASASSHATGVTINNASAVTGVSVGVTAAFTGLSINNANSGGGAGHNTVGRALVVYWNLKL